ncbi:MAG TPA: hypothetical protein VMB02_12915 [Candidatus Aquilonibacter sp.]|nr:hypothetical protein [Candidatus Aquilonibacter sp.]
MAKKTKKSAKRKISADEFSAEFTKLVSNHLAALPADEQDKRIRAAHRRVSRSRGASSTAREAADTPATRLSARTHE